MMVSRGRFLKICGAALLQPSVEPSSLLAAAVVAADAADGRRPRPRFQMQDASATLFRQHVKTGFSVRASDGRSFALVLAEVIEGPSHELFEQFMLLFHAAAGAAVSDGTYTFAHRVLGEFELFIVPVGGASFRRTVYQACFSRYAVAVEKTMHGR